MAIVRDMIRTKCATVHSVTPSATVFEAIEKMVRYNIGALVVIENDVPCGILTERDYLKRVALEGRTSKTTRVGDIMTTKLFTVSMDTPVSDCMEYFTNRRVRHLPVTDGERIVGIVSIGDVVKNLMIDQQQHIEHLEEYIQGRA